MLQRPAGDGGASRSLHGDDEAAYEIRPREDVVGVKGGGEGEGGEIEVKEGGFDGWVVGSWSGVCM